MPQLKRITDEEIKEVTNPYRVPSIEEWRQEQDHLFWQNCWVAQTQLSADQQIIDSLEKEFKVEKERIVKLLRKKFHITQDKYINDSPMIKLYSLYETDWQSIRKSILEGGQ